MEWPICQSNLCAMVALVGLQTSLLRYDLLYIFCDLAKSWKIDTYIVQLEVPGFKNNYIIKVNVL